MSDFFGAMGTALYSRLAGGTALTTALGGTAIYGDQAPDNATPPYVVFSHQSGVVEVDTADDGRDDIWFVRVYADTRAGANHIDGLLSDLLHRQTLTVSGWSVYWLVRELQLSLLDNLPNGERRFMAGGNYRIRLTR